MPLKPGTELQSICGPETPEGCFSYTKNLAGVSRIVVGAERGTGDFFATAEVYKGERLAFVMPLHALEHYELLAA